MMETLTEEKLIDLAEAVGDHKNVLKFGLKLEFKKSEVSTYISTNRRNDSFEGTTSMLFDWKRKTRRANQIPDITKALEDAGFAELVDDFFPSGGDVSQETATTSIASTSTGAADMSALPHTVSEKELLMLSMEIGPTYYKRVGINLNISIVTLENIKERSRDNCDALMTVFTRWRDKQLPDTNIRAHLAEALQKSGLVSLSQKLIPIDLLGTGASMPASQTQPLTPDLVERCRKELQSHYRRYFCKIRADSLNPRSLAPCKDIYTHLVLEEEDYRNKKRSLEYKDLFKLEINGEFPNRIIIQGEAGAGKTTLCAKIAWDWIDGSPDVPKFVWVLVIPLREVKRYTIGQIVKSYLSKDNPATACQITEYIRSNPEKVFIACDGLDEFSGKVVQHSETKQELEGAQPEPDDQPDARATSKRPKLMGHMSSRTPIAPLMPRGSISDGSESTSEEDDISLVHILRSDELSNCPVMVTSRPWKANEIKWDLNLMKLYAFIHVEGFSKKNVEVYVHKYFKDNTVTADQLIQMIKGNNIISEYMAPYPIYISMLCLMWRGLDDKKKELFKTIRTFSQLFHEMFEFLNVHYVQKEIQDLRSPSFNDHRSKIEKLMEPVAKLAFAGLQSNNLIFNEEDLEQYSDSVKTACKVGVLSQENKLSSIHDKSRPFLQSTFFFPHKLFQEYMAAVYLASLYDSDRNEFNRLIEEVVIPRKEEFRYLLYFTVSQNKNIAKYTTKCLLQQYIQSQDRKEMNFLVDVTFESQDEDTNAMLQNSVSSLSIDVKDTHTIAGYASTGIYSKAINMMVGAIRYTSYGPGISNEVARMICSASSLRDVRLKASFHPSFYETLAKEGRKAAVHTLEIWNNKPLSSASSHHLVEALCSLPNLTNLILRRVCDKEEFCSHLNEKASTLKVHTLKIQSYEPLSSASSHHLVEALCSLPNLTNLTLDGVCDKEFCSHLNEKASTLKVHTLQIEIYTPLSSASSHHLVEALCSLPNLTNLILRGVWDQEFCSHLNEKASTLKGSFPQIRKGNFIFNGKPQKDLQSFLQAVSDEIR
ncbi:NACHT, LRR and PYD domains-containing protein 12-like [Lytechinus pictus]|uniref:NACHT, LRR and PYD domains-containing protein 12-like n=1 Tax=Lytechinus pictus TaxID=7653 RepID=UPI0030B9EAF1